AYGAEPRRWPGGERSAAQGLLSVSAEARARLAAAAALDALLDQAADRPLAGGGALEEARLARLSARSTAAPQTALRESRQPRDRGLWVKAAGLAAAALIGFIVSWTQLVDMGPASTSTLSTTTSFDVAEDLSW